MAVPDDAIPGTVRWFASEEGWGVIDAAEVPGGCFVHFSNIAGEGWRSLDEGQSVVFTYEAPGFKQDGYDFRARVVWPAGQETTT
ncbi:MAG TPA: cold shock domain-containing protein [Acidimicrobiales bacterium]|nr:cold shock domain-containing protein [Acidimicrobiales bacterium]